MRKRNSLPLKTHLQSWLQRLGKWRKAIVLQATVRNQGKSLYLWSYESINTKTSSRWQQFVIESLSFKRFFHKAESFRSESNETKTALLLVSYCRTFRSIFARIYWNFQVSSMYIKTCKIFYISCKKKKIYIYIYIYMMMMIDKNQVQKATMLMNGIAFMITKMLPEMNYTCSRSSQMNKTVRILSCMVLWCSISDAWAAVFFYEISANPNSDRSQCHFRCHGSCQVVQTFQYKAVYTDHTTQSTSKRRLAINL